MTRALPSDPIIVVGMHRSGTSLVVQLLEKLGVFFGAIRDDNVEAVFFLKRNEALLRSCGGSWEHPSAVDGLLAQESSCEEIARRLKRDMHSVRFASYLGLRRWILFCVSGSLRENWGWKDPRNSVVLPIWLRVFPKARMIHVLRNGIDVALSLSERARKELTNPGRAPSISRYASADWRLHRLFEWREYVWNRIGPEGHLRVGNVPKTIDELAGLALWSEYVERLEHHLAAFAGVQLTLRYEDLLDRPEDSLDQLARFVGRERSPRLDAECLQLIRRPRAYAFQSGGVDQQVVDHARQLVPFQRHYPELCPGDGEAVTGIGIG